MKKILFLSALIGFGTAKADLITACGVSSSDGTREAIVGEKSIIGNCTVVRMDLTSIPTSLHEIANESFDYPLISESPAQIKFISCSNYNYLSVNYKNKLYSRKFKIGDETSI